MSEQHIVESDFELLEREPVDWQVKPLFAVMEEVNEKNIEGKVQNVLSLSYGKIVRRNVETNFGLLPETFNTYQIVHPGDIVLRLLDLQNDQVSLRVGLVPEMGVVTSAYVAVRPKGELDSEFAAYLLHAYDVRKVFYGYGGGCRQSMMFEDLRRLPILLPSLEEQRRIVDYLNEQTGKVDKLVTLRRRQIALLKEQRAALIQQAVTRGLNPNVPTKDSGHKWLGEVPAHWEVSRTKFVARLESGHTPSRQHPEWWENCTIPWVSLADVEQFRNGQIEYITETAENVSELGLANSSARLLPAGTVLVSRTASVGFSVIAGVALATTQDFVNWICGPRLLPEYLLYVFRSMRQEFKRLTSGSTHQTIYMPDVADFVTPLPPIEEQRAIYSYIKSISPKVDAAVDDLNHQTRLLAEYRASLIHECVTGRRRVGEDLTRVSHEQGR